MPAHRTPAALLAAVLCLAGCVPGDGAGGRATGDPLLWSFARDEAGGLSYAYPRAWEHHEVPDPPPGWEVRFEGRAQDTLRYAFGVYTALPEDMTAAQAGERFLRGFRGRRGEFTSLVRDHEHAVAGAADTARTDYTFDLAVAGEMRSARGTDIVVVLDGGEVAALRITAVAGEVPDRVVEGVAAGVAVA